MKEWRWVYSLSLAPSHWLTFFFALPRDILLYFLANEIGGNWRCPWSSKRDDLVYVEGLRVFSLLGSWMLRGRCPRIQFRLYSMKVFDKLLTLSYSS